MKISCDFQDSAVDGNGKTPISSRYSSDSHDFCGDGSTDIALVFNAVSVDPIIAAQRSRSSGNSLWP
jgi:hypothetical protein